VRRVAERALVSSAGESGRAAQIGSRLLEIHARIAQAARLAGRPSSEIRVVAVTKRLGPEDVRAAWAAGQRDFGENYVQEAVAKITALAHEMPDARWHLIGRLQSNKAAMAVPVFSLLHAIDSPSAVAAIAKAAQREGRTVDVLLQIRLGERGSAAARERGGVEAGEAASLLEIAGRHAGVRFTGLMGIADPDLEARPQFAELRELAGRLASLGLPHAPLGELSMGMTGDFEDAVAEGATLVRIGTAIFGQRPSG
jgi:pyridoxal phosphate enzyme (YggS family)